MIIPIYHGLLISSILFVLGLFIIMIRRNFLFILIGIEIMINAVSLSSILAGSYWNQSDGQIIFILSITIAAVESSIGLSLLMKLYLYKSTLDIDLINEIKK